MPILHFRETYEKSEKMDATDELGIFTLKAAMRLLSSFQPQNTAATSSDLSSVKEGFLESLWKWVYKNRT